MDRRPPRSPLTRVVACFSLLAGSFFVASPSAIGAGVDLADATASASSTNPGASPGGPIDGDRFSAEAGSTWRGEAGKTSWTWELKFPQPRRIGAILQLVGDDAEVLQNAPRRAVWQVGDGETWTDLEETRVDRETRMFRLHRLKKALEARALRLVIDEALGESPTLREIEIYAEPDAKVEFPDWIASVCTFDAVGSLQETPSFVALVRQCEGWSDATAQRLWKGDFDRAFVETEPRPLCAFLTGNIREWCQQDREPWRGIGEVLKARCLPIWGSCGGAQGLAILEERGVDLPWDCPRCRDPEKPMLPIYSHIGHVGPAPCGDYSQNLAERGPTNLRIEAQDPVLAGLTDQFQSMESHVGQVAYIPKGWTRLVTAGDGAKTLNQLLRVDGYPIYAAQFHIEMQGTPDSSRLLMSNFLSRAKERRERGGRGDAGDEDGSNIP